MLFTKKETEHYDYPQLCLFQDKHDVAEYINFLSSEGELSDNETCLYIHVPFCRSFCVFCNYYKVMWGKIQNEGLTKFIDSVVKEIRFYASLLPDNKRYLSGIHFGGGTPTLLSYESLKLILAAIKENFDLRRCGQLSIEGTIQTLSDTECISQLKDLDFNRVSFGIQTFSPELRKKYGLTKEISDIDKLCSNLTKWGLIDYNVDLMYNFPEQGPEDVIWDIERAFELGVMNIDLYRLNVFPMTRLYYRFKDQGIWDDYFSSYKENRYIDIYKYISSHNEINLIMSNTISRKRKTPHKTLAVQLGNSRDNGGNTIGVGPSSRGYIDGYVYRNHVSIEKYIESVDKKGFGVVVGNRTTQEEIENRTLVMFPNFTYIDKDDANGIVRNRDKIDTLIENGYIYETEDKLIIDRENCFWAGNISSFFFSDKQKQKMVNSYLLTRKEGKNLYNQDDMRIIKP